MMSFIIEITLSLIYSITFLICHKLNHHLDSSKNSASSTLLTSLISSFMLLSFNSPKAWKSPSLSVFSSPELVPSFPTMISQNNKMQRNTIQLGTTCLLQLSRWFTLFLCFITHGSNTVNSVILIAHYSALA